MAIHVFQVFIIYIFAFLLSYCQIPIYHCHFDMGLTGNCIFNRTIGARDLTISNGDKPSNSPPTQPLSDVSSILSLTTPDNESCKFPYNFPMGNWSMHFCQSYTTINYTCPTESGTGQCVIGNYGLIKANYGSINHTYFTKIETKSNTAHYLDFYYYLTDALDDPKITVGLEANGVTESIVEVTALSDNKWQHMRTIFTSPSSEIYLLWFRMTRNSESFEPFVFALDEIKIFERSYEYTPTTISILADTTEEIGEHTEMSSGLYDSITIMASESTTTPSDTTSSPARETSSSSIYGTPATTNTHTTTRKLESTTTTKNTNTTIIKTTPFTAPITSTTATMSVIKSTTTETIDLNTTSASPWKINPTLVLGLSLGSGLSFVLCLMCCACFCVIRYCRRK